MLRPLLQGLKELVWEVYFVNLLKIPLNNKKQEFQVKHPVYQDANFGPLGYFFRRAPLKLVLLLLQLI